MLLVNEANSPIKLYKNTTIDKIAKNEFDKIRKVKKDYLVQLLDKKCQVELKQRAQPDRQFRL